MSQTENFAETMAAWAAREPSVKALVLFGSRVRAEDDPVWSPDAHSDWDFQVITSNPRMFCESAWLRDLLGSKLHVYAGRVPRLGILPKINAVISGAEADFVILPARVLRLAKLAVNLGMHDRPGRIRRRLQDLAIVMRPGYRFLKGGKSWEPFYRRVVDEVSDPRIDDAEVKNLAEGFVYDYVWALRKLDRGELLAVQRLLHRELAETNFRLLHELKLRRGELSFPDARRLERIATPEELLSLRVNSIVEANQLRGALSQSATTLNMLVTSLVGATWHWPKM